ncbi:hypothetical protein D3C77_602500 [compost metagenome]
MHQGVALLAHLLLEFIAVVGGDHQRGQRHTPLGVDRRHRIDAIAAVVQVIVGDQQVGVGAVGRHLTRQVLFAQGSYHLAPPLLQQGAHPRTDRRVVIQHPDACTLQAFAQRLTEVRLHRSLRCPLALRYANGKHRALAGH